MHIFVKQNPKRYSQKSYWRKQKKFLPQNMPVPDHRYDKTHGATSGIAHKNGIMG